MLVFVLNIFIALKYMLLLLAIQGIPLLVNAQITIKTGKLFVRQDSRMTIEADLINKDSVINGGAISLTGDWYNTGAYLSSGETLMLNGATQQVFTHNAQSVNNLIINNASGINITTDVNITSGLTLQKGIVSVVAGKQVMMSENASIQGGSSESFISGAIYHTGTGDKFYPIGKNGQYAPVKLANIEGDQPVIGVEFFDEHLALDVMNDFKQEPFYWQFQTLSGDYERANLTAQMSTSAITQSGNLLMAVANNAEDTLKTLSSTENHRADGWLSFTNSLSDRITYLTLGIIKLPENIVYIPNAVSPMAPNAEDRTVKIYSKHVESTDFQWTIWDAWGHVVYHTKSYEQASTIGWQKAHEERNSGIYQYLLHARLTNGQVYSKTGNIVLYD